MVVHKPGELSQTMAAALRAHLLEDDLGRAILRNFDAGVLGGDAFLMGELHRRVQSHENASLFRGPFQVPRLSRGDFILGLDEKGDEVRVPLQFLVAHSLCLASTGAGKSTAAMFRALQVGRLVAGLWLFDLRKREWAKLAPALARVGIDLIAVSARQMRFNPLQCPAHVAPRDWIAHAAEILVFVLDLPPRATKMLHALIHHLYDEHQITSDRDDFPTLFDLFLAAKTRAANPQAKQALLDSLEVLLLDLGPDVLNFRRGWTTADLAALPINFVLGDVTPASQNLILAWLLRSEFASRVAKGFSNEPLSLFVSLDEAQRVLAPSAAGASVLKDLLPLVRGCGLALDLAVPSSHRLIPEAISSTNTKYLGRCGSATDYEVLARAMALSREQVVAAQQSLVPGTFIAQVGEGTWRKPFVLTIPPLNPKASAHPASPMPDIPVTPAKRLT